MGVSIDRFDFEALNDDSDNFISHNWLIDTDKGWRRTDNPHYEGVCEVNKGYTVCSVRNIAFGEATFAIHPDGSNFTLVYLDYGLDVLAFVESLWLYHEKTTNNNNPTLLFCCCSCLNKHECP